MWVYSEKQKTWVNLEQVQRIASDGQGGYLLISQDGKKTSIDQSWYDKAMRWVDPDWWEKHPDGRKDSLNFEEALKAIEATPGEIEAMFGASGDVAAMNLILRKFNFDIDSNVKSVQQGVVTLSDSEIISIATAIHTYVVENNLSFDNIIRIMFSVLAGVSSGGGTTDITFKDNANTKNRVEATVDTNGDRLTVTLDGE